jgi:hypothetical protein
MPESRLKPGKGASFFVKTQLRRLHQEDNTWKADFFPMPCSDSEHDSVGWGIVFRHFHDKAFAQHTVKKLPLNDLLADADE